MSGESKSLSGDDIYKLLNGKTNIIEYPDLANYNSVEELLSPFGNVVILYLSSEDYGHWTTLFQYPNSNVIEFFDPYSMVPDGEFRYIDTQKRKELKESSPLLSELLIKYDGPIEYNNYKFQRFAKNVNTCGRWVVLRLTMKDLTLEQFRNIFITDAKKFKFDRDELVTYLTS